MTLLVTHRRHIKPYSDQRRGIKQVCHAQNCKTTHSSSDTSAVLQLADGKRLTLREVELDVPL